MVVNNKRGGVKDNKNAAVALKSATAAYITAHNY